MKGDDGDDEGAAQTDRPGRPLAQKVADSNIVYPFFALTIVRW